jgi:hypothetical protein
MRIRDGDVPKYPQGGDNGIQKANSVKAGNAKPWAKAVKAMIASLTSFGKCLASPVVVFDKE